MSFASLEEIFTMTNTEMKLALFIVKTGNILMSQINLLEGDFLCCGTLCPKNKAQEHIDRMQRAIDKLEDYL